MRSPVYWHPSFYHFVMRQLYGQFFELRYEAIAKLLPKKASVVELCMGDAYLYRNYLSVKQVKYLGLDMNEMFVRTAVKKNIPAKIHNILTDEIPGADYIIMQASLYQFIPNEKSIIRKMLDAAKKTAVISEPVQNLADSKNFFISQIGKYSTNAGKGHSAKRFSQQSLLECFKSFKEFREELTVEAGREIIGVFRK